MNLDYRTASDGSYTLTYTAVVTATANILNDWIHGFPGALQMDHIFATLTMAEGYDDRTARSLSRNPLYRQEIARMQKKIIEAATELGMNNV